VADHDVAFLDAGRSFGIIQNRLFHGDGLLDGLGYSWGCRHRAVLVIKLAAKIGKIGEIRRRNYPEKMRTFADFNVWDLWGYFIISDGCFFNFICKTI
jgi:hypothetical protein